MIKLFIFGFISLILTMQNALAVEKIVCDPEDFTTTGMSACATDEYEKADKKLNELYPKVIEQAKKLDQEFPMGGIDPYSGYEESVRSSQRAWVQYRDAECLIQTIDVVGGSLRRVTYPSCRAQMTNDRVKQLENLFNKSE